MVVYLGTFYYPFPSSFLYLVFVCERGLHMRPFLSLFIPDYHFTSLFFFLEFFFFCKNDRRGVKDGLKNARSLLRHAYLLLGW